MRICIDLTSLADNFSGIERYAACLSKEMIQDTSIEFILIFKECVHSIFEDDVNKENIKILVLKRCNKLFFNQIRLPSAIRRIKADYYLFLAFPVPIFLFKKNMISTIHDICCWDCPETMNGMSKWYFRISHKIAVKKCKYIITISEFSKRRICEKLNCAEDNIWLIYCGINMNDFNIKCNNMDRIKEKYNLPDDYILSLSTLEPRKNIQLLIHAYENLLRKGKKLPDLVLAGRKGWKMDEFFESIDYNVKKHIVFTGFIDDSDIADVYSSAKLFVFPSLYEGFGMPPVESLACGTPVLSSNAASMPEVLGKNALYFENNNIESLEKNLSVALDNIEDGNMIVNNVALNRFNWNAQAKILAGKLNC